MNVRLPVLLTVFLLLSTAMVMTPSDATAQCSVCKACGTAADCGPGETCFDFGISIGRYCTMTPCTPGGCPGDSACYTITLNEDPPATFCVNPTADQIICDPSYTCFDDGEACSGLGTDCAAGASACTAVGSALCVTITDQTGDHSFCSCYCSTDAECGPGNQCLTLSGGQKACKAGPTTGLCSGVSCPTGESCDIGTGNCVLIGGELCDNVICQPGAICSPATGTCIGGATDTSPPTDTSADVGPADTGTVADTGTTTSNDTSVSQDTSTTIPNDTTLGQDTGTTTANDTLITTTDTGTTTADSGGGQFLEPLDDGCGCSTSAPARSWPTPALLLFGVLGVLGLRRRCFKD